MLNVRTLKHIATSKSIPSYRSLRSLSQYGSPSSDCTRMIADMERMHLAEVRRQQLDHAYRQRSI